MYKVFYYLEGNKWKFNITNGRNPFGPKFNQDNRVLLPYPVRSYDSPYEARGKATELIANAVTPAVYLSEMTETYVISE